MDRLAKVRQKLRDLEISALFVTGQSNVKYLTHVSGLDTGEREIFMLITGSNSYLFAFSTTYLMYKNIAGFKTIQLTVDFRLNQALNGIIQKEKLKTVGFESENINYVEFKSLKEKINTDLVETQSVIESFRVLKNESEIGKIEKAARITDAAFKYILGEIKTGVSEKEIALKIEFYIRSRTQDISFSPIVAFNQNTAIPHYLPSPQVKLAKNSIILIDIGAKFENYGSDLTRVVFNGNPKPEWLKIYNTVSKSQTAAIRTLKPGIAGEVPDKTARAEISKSKFPVYNHGLGHGVGLDIHENPRLRPGIKTPLLENMVFTIEPGIYVEGVAGVRIEDLLVLKHGGPELLSRAPKELIIL